MEDSIKAEMAEVIRKAKAEVVEEIYTYYKENQYRVNFNFDFLKMLETKVIEFSDREYCEEYHGFYGDKAVPYGGIITKLNDLPEKTFFYVANGCWYGCIERDETEKYIRMTDEHNVKDYGHISLEFRVISQGIVKMSPAI